MAVDESVGHNDDCGPRSGSGKRRFDVTPLMREFADLTAAAEVFGVPKRTLHRWMVDGVDEWKADEIAIRARHHPASIWPDWFDGVDLEEPLTLFGD